MKSKTLSQLELSPIFFHLHLPLPLHPFANSPLYLSQLQREPRPQFLQPDSDSQILPSLHTTQPLPARRTVPVPSAPARLLIPCIPERVPVPSEEDIIPLVMQRH